MATLNKDVMYPTLATLAARMDGKGRFITDTVEILNETNEVLEDMVFEEANGGTSHKIAVRNGLPGASWRTLYKGVKPSTSAVTQVEESIGMLEARSFIDQKLLQLNGNSAAWLAAEQKPFIEALNQVMAETFWYNDGIAHPERFMGLAPRFSDKSAPNGKNIIDAGGTGNNNASIWLIVWSRDTCFGIYPKGSKAGIDSQDIGVNTVTDDNGGRYEAHEKKHSWDMGLCVKDWRYIVRIANIDVTQLRKDLTSGANLPDLMADALEMLPNMMGRPAFYMNRTLRRILRGQIQHSAQYTISQAQVGGKRVTTFGDGEGVPVRISDALLSTEAQVK
ncbi:MAG: hypothetical protein Q4A74_01620 [Cardiobacteriaceae bacterium]|nr:hypothetical protein [Cardiobacteriaceae bacterium]